MQSKTGKLLPKSIGKTWKILLNKFQQL